MALTPKQEILTTLLNTGTPSSVATFLEKNESDMLPFLSPNDHKLDYPALVNILRDGPAHQIEEIREHIGECIDCALDKLPAERVKLPARLKRKAARKEGIAELLLLVETMGTSLRNIMSFNPINIAKGTVGLLIKVPTELIAGIQGLVFGLDRKERMLTTAAATIPLIGTGVAKLAFGAALTAGVIGTSVSDTKASIPPSADATTLEQTHLQTPPSTGGSKLAYNATQQFGSMAQLINAAMSKPGGKIFTDPYKIYRPFLNLIEKGESTVGGYNAVYLPYARANKGTKFNLTGMSLDQISKLQKQILTDGFDASPVGKYQIIPKTMTYLKKKIGLKGSEIFSEDLQDRMAITLLRRRGVDSYLNGTMSEKDFLEALSKEWASFPKDKTGVSYYKGVGNNKAHISFVEVQRAAREASNIAVAMGKGNKQFSFNLPTGGKAPIPRPSPRGLKHS